MWPFSKREKRGFTEQAMEVRADQIMGRRGVAELTACVQSSLSLWENSLSLAETSNALLTPEMLSLTARSLGLRGESLWLIGDDELLPVSDYDLSTRGPNPRAYRLTIPSVGGGYQVNALAPEVLHIRIGRNVRQPWHGTPPLHRAQLSAELLQAVVDGLHDVYANSPLGSQIVATPEMPKEARQTLQQQIGGQRGRVMLPESTNVSAAGGPSPQNDWQPSSISPDLSNTLALDSLKEAQNSIYAAFGVVPAMMTVNATGPLIREAQQHLNKFTLSPIAKQIESEASRKLSQTSVSLDPLYTADIGARARAMSAVVQAMAQAKEAGIDPELAKQFAGVNDG